MNKDDVVTVLEGIATYLELKGENPFKVRAYSNAARSLQSVEGDIGELLASGEIAKLPGIGESILEKIQTLVKTGKLPYYEELKSSFPDSIIELLDIPGLGPKRIKTLYDTLGISSIGELEYACKENRLRDMEGFGQKSQDNILKGIEQVKKFKERFLISDAMDVAHQLFEKLKKHKTVIRASIAGSLRRHRETVKDVDILASVRDKDRPLLMEFFTSQKEVASIVAKGETKSSVTLATGINADLRLVTDKQYPYALLYFTGSKEHNIAIRGLLKKKGMKLNEYGLFKGDKLIPCKDEQEIYKKLHLAYIPPELREDNGEIEAARKGKLPELLEYGELKGTFHIHSRYSDGVDSIENIAKEIKKMGFSYFGLTDHSETAAYAGGLDKSKLTQQFKEVEKTAEKLPDITIFKGIEIDILPDGSIDYNEKTWKQFDFIIASVHSKFGMSEKDMTKRIIKAMKNPYVTMLGHPTGRLLLSRQPYPVNIPAILEAAKEHNVIIELNANPHRLDLDWRHGKYAKELGVLVSINPDAHNLKGIYDVRFGVGIARKGWLGAKDILNTRSAQEVKKLFTKLRKG